MTTQWLYRYEVKGIQDFIFQTNRLKEIIGASSLIEELGELFEHLLERAGCAISKEDFLQPPAAGSASVKVCDDHLEAFRGAVAAWPMIVSRHAPGLQVVQALVPRSEDGNLDHLHTALRADRSRIFPELPVAGPLVMRAPRTGLPACITDSRAAGGKTLVLDAGSDRKRKRKDVDVVAKRLGSWRWVEDLEKLSHSYVGVVHADGNDMGRTIQRLIKDSSSDTLMLFSTELSKVVMEATRAAIREVLEPNVRPDGRLPARPIIVGGDDVTFLVRGDLAYAFSVALLQHFEAQARQSGNDQVKKVTACAGLALVHKSHPFSLAYELAEELCTHAKKVCRRNEGSTPSALAFHRLTTSFAGGWKELLEEELRVDHDSEVKLTLNPYRLNLELGVPSIEGLNRLMKAMKHEGTWKVPRSKLREWVDLHQHDALRVGEHVARIGEIVRAKNHGDWQEFVESLALLGVGDVKDLEGLGERKGAACLAEAWREKQGDTETIYRGTPLLDALSLLALKKEGTHEAAQAGEEA